MAVSVAFFAGESNNINNLAGSGLGFYGSNFGFSVPVGQNNQTTYITNGAGTTQGPQSDNIKWSHPNSGVLNSNLTSNLLTHLPNQNATLNVRVSSDAGNVNVTSPKLRIYDRTTTSSAATGVTTFAAELIHPESSIAAGGSGDSVWMVFSGTSASDNASLDLSPNPGVSGLYAGNGSNSVRADAQHDWYIALSASPDSIGSKSLYGLVFEFEYA
jgi:hypothetical protein